MMRRSGATRSWDECGDFVVGEAECLELHARRCLGSGLLLFALFGFYPCRFMLSQNVNVLGVFGVVHFALNAFAREDVNDGNEWTAHDSAYP